MTFEEYESNLDENLRSLVQRLVNKSYRARLVRRKYIPKGGGKLRPLGIPTLEDKLVQLAVAQILSAIFAYRHEAEAFGRAVPERLAKFGLELAPDKTQTWRFGRGGGEHNGRFDFLGFEFRWEKSRKGFAIVKRRTSRKKLRGAVARFTEWVREHRHEKLKPLMKSVAQKHQGHWNYYGIIGNSESLSDYRTLTLRALFKGLNRRSQRGSYTWRSFNRLLKRFDVPLPRIKAKASSPELRRAPARRDESVGGINLFGWTYQASGA